MLAAPDPGLIWECGNMRLNRNEQGKPIEFGLDGRPIPHRYRFLKLTVTEAKNIATAALTLWGCPILTNTEREFVRLTLVGMIGPYDLTAEPFEEMKKVMARFDAM